MPAAKEARSRSISAVGNVIQIITAAPSLHYNGSKVETADHSSTLSNITVVLASLCPRGNICGQRSRNLKARVWHHLYG